MRFLSFYAALAASVLLACSPASAQKISALPNATTLTGAEKVAGIQGSGCPTGAAPCSTVGIAVSQLGTYASAGSQPLDADLSAIAALTTQSFGRSLLTQPDAPTTRTTIGVTATGADTTYAYRANNLSDLASASTARTNLGVSATGTDTAYAFRANNLSDLANAGTARTNLGLGTMATQGSGAVAITGGTIAGITDLAVADGGTGASTAANARTNLGVAIGSNVQAWSTQLDALAALSGQTYGRSLITTASAQAAAVSITAPWNAGQSGNASSVTGTLTKTTLATITIPANSIGANGSIEVDVIFTGTSSANNKSYSVDFGGTTLWGSTATTNPVVRTLVSIFNKNATNSQNCLSSSSGTGIANTATILASSIDTTAPVNITLTGTLANTGETITLLHYLVRVTYGA